MAFKLSDTVKEDSCASHKEKYQNSYILDEHQHNLWIHRFDTTSELRKTIFNTFTDEYEPKIYKGFDVILNGKQGFDKTHYDMAEYHLIPKTEIKQEIKQETKQEIEKPEYDKPVVLFFYAWVESWQHFMQDLVPVILSAKSYLDNNPDWIILTKRGKFVSMLRDIFKIKNRIVESWLTIHPKNISDSLIIFERSNGPQNIVSNMRPLKWYGVAHQLIKNYIEEKNREENISENRNKDYIVYCSRKGLTACPRQDEEISKLDPRIRVFSELQNISLSDRFRLFYDAKMVIAPYGDGCYNIIACKPGTVFVEIFGTEYIINSENYAIGLEMRYFPLISYNLRKQFTQSYYDIDPVLIKQIIKFTMEKDTKMDKIDKIKKIIFSQNSRVSLREQVEALASTWALCQIFGWQLFLKDEHLLCIFDAPVCSLEPTLFLSDEKENIFQLDILSIFKDDVIQLKSRRFFASFLYNNPVTKKLINSFCPQGELIERFLKSYPIKEGQLEIIEEQLKSLKSLKSSSKKISPKIKVLFHDNFPIATLPVIPGYDIRRIISENKKGNSTEDNALYYKDANNLSDIFYKNAISVIVSSTDLETPILKPLIPSHEELKVLFSQSDSDEWWKNKIVNHICRNATSKIIRYNNNIKNTGMEILLLGSDDKQSQFLFKEVNHTPVTENKNAANNIQRAFSYSDLPAAFSDSNLFKKFFTTITPYPIRISQLQSSLKIYFDCNWCKPEELMMQWRHLSESDNLGCNYPQQIQFSPDRKIADYFVIINRPGSISEIVPEKTIVFRMEPYIDTIPYYSDWVKSLDKSKFLFWGCTEKHRNNAEWWLPLSLSALSYPIYKLSPQKLTKFPNNSYLYDNEPTEFDWQKLFLAPSKQEIDLFTSVVSNKEDMPGHKLRLSTLDYLFNIKGYDNCHIYGTVNKHRYARSWKTNLPERNKILGLFMYKYNLAVENSSIINYVTEKFWDGLLAECLTFYWGCPNLEEWVDPRVFIRLSEDPAKNFEIIKQAVNNKEWEKRIEIIREEKKRVLRSYAIYYRVSSIIYLSTKVTINITQKLADHPSFSSFKNKQIGKGGEEWHINCIRAAASKGKALFICEGLPNTEFVYDHLTDELSMSSNYDIILFGSSDNPLCYYFSPEACRRFVESVNPNYIERFNSCIAQLRVRKARYMSVTNF